MNPLLFCAIGTVRAWTRFYTFHMDQECGGDRRAEIESDLWEFHEDARRRGDPPAAIGAHVLARLLFGMPHDLMWRMEYEGESPVSKRRSTLMTAAAISAAIGLGALWALFAVTSLGSLTPLPDSTRIERVYLNRQPHQMTKPVTP